MTLLVMSYIIEENSKGRTVPRGSYIMHELEHGDGKVEPCIKNVKENNNVSSFGCNSELFAHQSQEHVQFSQDDLPHEEAIQSNYFKLGLPAYEDMINSCSNKVQFEECMELMKNPML